MTTDKYIGMAFFVHFLQCFSAITAQRAHAYDGAVNSSEATISITERTIMPTRYLVLLGFLACLMWNISSADADADLELYGTFHAMGVIVTMDDGDDPDADAEASVTYRTGSEAFQSGFPLSRITDERFVGSLFRLEPGTSYDVSVAISDPDGGALDGIVLQGSMSTRPEIEIPTPQDTFYVAPDGSGTECSLAAPCALTQGISLAGPGDEVVLRGGTYATENIIMPRSGSKGAPIVVRGYTGETAVIDGADQQTYTWTAYGNGVYTTTAAATNIHLVMADGKRIFPYESLNNLIELYWDDTPGFYQDGSTLYVHLENDKNPDTASMVVSRYGTAFTVEQDFIYFLDLTFKHYGQGSYPKVFYLDNASDILIQNCAFIDNDLGVGIKRESHRNVIQDNVFSDTIFDWPWDGIKTLGGLEDGGVQFYDPVNGRGNIIRRNTFHDDFDGFGVCPSTTAALTNETDVYDNVVYNMGDDGIETDGRCSNVRIWGNTFHDVLIGISLAPVYDGPVYALRNLVYRTGVGNNNYPGSPFKFNSGYDLSGPMYLFHNTSDAVFPGNNGIYIKAPGTWRMIYARNNIWAGTDYAVNNYNTDNPVDMDYDNLYNAGLNDLARWNNVRYATLDAFSAATGQEINGFNVTPGFLDADQQLYNLDPQSDLVDAGVYIPGINQGYSGSAPDLGAFELDTGNHGPVGVNDTAVTDADTAAAIDVIANDQDAEDDALSIANFVTLSANGGSVSRQDDAHLLYTPPTGFSGVDTFTYSATDGQDESNIATVTVTVQESGSDTGDDDDSDDGDSDSDGGGGCFINLLHRSIR